MGTSDAADLAGGNGTSLIKPWEVHGEGREFENISNDFARATIALENGLAGHGTPWGPDETGAGFDAKYSGARDGILTALEVLADQLGGIGSGLHTMAENATRTDGDVRTDFAGGQPSGSRTQLEV